VTAESAVVTVQPTVSNGEEGPGSKRPDARHIPPPYEQIAGNNGIAEQSEMNNDQDSASKFSDRVQIDAPPQTGP
jgi:hypothetical protein